MRSTATTHLPNAADVLFTFLTSENATSPQHLITELCINHFGLIKQQDVRSGNTALHIAVENNNSLAALLLCFLGADTNARNKQGISPLHLALSKQQYPLAFYMQRCFGGVLGSVQDEAINKVINIARGCEYHALIKKLTEADLIAKGEQSKAQQKQLAEINLLAGTLDCAIEKKGPDISFIRAPLQSGLGNKANEVNEVIRNALPKGPLWRQLKSPFANKEYTRVFNTHQISAKIAVLEALFSFAVIYGASGDKDSVQLTCAKALFRELVKYTLNQTDRTLSNHVLQCAKSHLAADRARAFMMPDEALVDRVVGKSHVGWLEFFGQYWYLEKINRFPCINFETKNLEFIKICCRIFGSESFTKWLSAMFEVGDIGQLQLAYHDNPEAVEKFMRDESLSYIVRWTKNPNALDFIKTYFTELLAERIVKRDLENIFRKFEGSNETSELRWIDEHFNDQLVIFARRLVEEPVDTKKRLRGDALSYLLKNHAKLFYQGGENSVKLFRVTDHQQLLADDLTEMPEFQIECVKRSEKGELALKIAENASVLVNKDREEANYHDDEIKLNYLISCLQRHQASQALYHLAESYERNFRLVSAHECFQRILELPNCSDEHRRLVYSKFAYWILTGYARSNGRKEIIWLMPAEENRQRLFVSEARPKPEASQEKEICFDRGLQAYQFVCSVLQESDSTHKSERELCELHILGIPVLSRYEMSQPTSSPVHNALERYLDFYGVEGGHMLQAKAFIDLQDWYRRNRNISYRICNSRILKIRSEYAFFTSSDSELRKKLKQEIKDELMQEGKQMLADEMSRIQEQQKRDLRIEQLRQMTSDSDSDSGCKIV